MAPNGSGIARLDARLVSSPDRQGGVFATSYDCDGTPSQMVGAWSNSAAVRRVLRGTRWPARREILKKVKPEYDFAKGERGKFFRPDAEMRVAIHLEPEVQDYLLERAADKGVPLSELVNSVLKHDIEVIESVK